MFCINCGAKCSEGAAFCNNCGTKIAKSQPAVKGVHVIAQVEKASLPKDKNILVLVGIVIAVIALIVILVQLSGISESDLIGRWELSESTHPNAVANWIEFSPNGEGQMGRGGSFRWRLERDGVLVVTQMGISIEYDIAISGRRLTFTLEDPWGGTIRSTYIRQ